MTFGRITHYKTSLGSNGYKILAAAMDDLSTPPKTVVDLACGDGPLIKILLEKAPQGQIIGIDMSRGELEKARKKIRSKNVKFLREHAQSLSLPDHSVDCVLCHLALMLMKPVEKVIEEIGRILKPGGLFAGIVLVPAKEGTLFYKFSQMLSRLLREEFSDLLCEGFGDPRVKTRGGLLSLFSEKHWRSKEMKLKEGEFLMDDTADALWNNLRGFYLPRLLSDINQQKLGELTRKLFVNQGATSGIIPLRLPFRYFSVKRAGEIL